MLRQQSSRNARAKGFKVKHFLQISVLVLVCIWLIYQVKHSHDKKKAFEESNTRSLRKLDESKSDIFRVSRKDLPRIEETVKEMHSEEEEHGEAKEVEKESKAEETERSEGRGVGDAPTDELDLEEAVRSEEFDDGEGKDDKTEELDALENQDHDADMQEAREESFKGDDASSAVSEDNKRSELESEGEGQAHFVEERSEHTEGIDVEKGNIANATHDGLEMIKSADGSQSNDPVVVLGETVTTSDDALVMNKADAENGESVVDVSKSENGSYSNSMIVGSMNKADAENNKVSEIDEPKSEDGSRSNSTIVELMNKADPVSGESEVAVPKSEDGSHSSSTTDESDKPIELQTDTTIGSISQNEKEVQTGSEAADVSDNPMEAHNTTPETNSNHSDAVDLGSVQDRNTTGVMGTGNDSKPENVVIEERSEKLNVTEALEKSNESSSTNSTTNGNDDAAQRESQSFLEGAIKDGHNQLDRSIAQKIQNESQSDKDVSSE